MVGKIFLSGSSASIIEYEVKVFFLKSAQPLKRPS